MACSFPRGVFLYNADRIYWKNSKSETTSLVTNDEDKENMSPGDDNDEGNY